MNCPRRIFSSGYVSIPEGIDEKIEHFISRDDESTKIIEHSKLDYKQIRRLFINLIYKKLPNKGHEELKNFDWVLIEYFGLISTADQEHGPWNRLVSQVHHCILYNHKDGYNAVVFFVEYSNFAVATRLGVNWSGQPNNWFKSLAPLTGTG